MSQRSILEPGEEAGRGVEAGAIREQVRRIVESRGFKASERMVRLLCHVVEETLEGRSDELKEYSIGVQVYDRGEAFDPRTDPIVRVEARRLRAKLRSYYEGEGAGDPVVIEIPTGCYVARFVMRGVEDGATPAAMPSTAIAVLPFKNLSPEADAEYFSDGLTEELIHALTKVPGLRVVAWDTAAQLREGDCAEIGRRLGVGSILQGSVRRAAERLRITVRLENVATSEYLWSETFDRRVEDLFAIQEEIARSVAASLRVKLFGPEPVPEKRREWDMRVYDLYLRGRFQWNKRSQEGFQRAAAYFREAVTLDPGFAPGYAGLSDTYSLLADHGMESPEVVMPLAKEAANRALEIDPTLGEAYCSLALIESLYEWRWKEAEAHYLRALELHPGYATAHHWYAADYLLLLGRFEEALEIMKTAVQLDPLSMAIRDSLAYHYMVMGRFEEALTTHLENLEIDGHFHKAYTGMGRVYLLQGNPAEGVRMLERGRELAGDLPTLLGALAQGQAQLGNEEEARRLLVRMEQMSRHRHVPATAFAIAHLGLGEREESLRWLERSCERREMQLCVLNVHPLYTPLRGEKRFRAIVERMGLGPTSS